MNVNEKQANIDQFIETIEEKKKYVVENKDLKKCRMSMIEKFCEKKVREYYYRLVFKHLKIRHYAKKEKKRIAAYSRNTCYRAKLQKIFRSWRTVSHTEGKQRINDNEKTFRLNLEREKLTMWTSKVDQLMLYIAQLEDKIKTEV